MLKHKKFLSILLALPLFINSSCAKVSDTYTVYQNGDAANKLECQIPKEWNEEIKIASGQSVVLSLDGLVVSYNGAPLSTLAKKLEDAKKPDTYFICTSNSVPSKSIIGNLEIKWSNAQVNTELNFYIAHIDYDGESKSTSVHLSEKVTIKINNEGAFIGSWFIPVITIVVAILVFLMVFFTHRYKMKKEGK